MSFKPRIQSIEQKYANNGIFISWEKSTLTSGSINVFRTDLGRYGTYGSIGSTGITAVNYTDTAGSADSWYKIQIFDGTGSSPFSNDISLTRNDYLCTDLDVRSILRFSSISQDIGSAEIEQAILDAQDEIYSDYGKPLKRTYTNMSTLGSKYWIKPNRESIYALDRITVAGSEVPLGSYNVNLLDGTVVFNSAYVTSEAGEIVEFEWSPTVFNLLCKNIAAKSLTDDLLITSPKGTEDSKTDKLQLRIDKYKAMLDSKNIFLTSKYETYDERDAEYVIQTFTDDLSG